MGECALRRIGKTGFFLTMVSPLMYRRADLAFLVVEAGATGIAFDEEPADEPRFSYSIPRWLNNP
jgi:hypothetical protein